MKWNQLKLFFFPNRSTPGGTPVKKPKDRVSPRPKSHPKYSNTHVERSKAWQTDSLYPDLKSVWDEIALEYFPELPGLSTYRMTWSNRKQTRCLASCNVEKRVVRVASAMAQPEAMPYLAPLLYHEMCHAVVGIKIVRGRRRMHTSEFKQLENRHPGIHELDRWINAGGWALVVRKDIIQRTYNSRRGTEFKPDIFRL